MVHYSANPQLRSYCIGAAVNLAAWIFIVGWISSIYFDEVAKVAIEHSWTLNVLALIALWRYIWIGTHYCRALIYQYITFPRLRMEAIAAPKASHIYIVVLSYRMDAEINGIVYSALAQAIRSYGCWGTIVACVSDEADVEVLCSLELPYCVRLVSLKQSGRGKRDAIERGLTFLANESIPPNSYVALVDGDSVVLPDTFNHTLPLLMNNPNIGALTTDNIPAVWGSDLLRQWYWVRMQHRHIMMCSLALSRKVLVLTGRFSLFRADIALSRAFIAQVGRDSISHWRLGRIKMLTGDDKSTWFAVLKEGHGTLYVPDVQVVCLEKAVSNHLVSSTIPLMVRYFGNMARNNGRAIKLGPNRVGWFAWWCLVDQRLSPWTTMLAPLAAVISSFVWWPGTVIAYLCWAFFTRTMQCILIGGIAGRVHPYMPFVLMFNQMTGAVVKVFMFFNLDRQKWTRQETGKSKRDTEYSSAMMMWASMAVFTVAVSLFVIMGR